MKNKLILFLAIAFAGCEKVIDVKLKNTSPLLVAEAAVWEGRHDVTVKLSRTKDYYDNTTPSFVSGAIVTFSDSLQTYNLTDVGNGTYLLPGYLAQGGKAYRVNINSGGQYEAMAFMPVPVVLDSVSYKFENASVFTDEGYLIYAEFNDPADRQNFYQIKLTVNDTLQNKPEDLFVFDDELTNGRHIKIPIFIKRFQAGDRIKMELISMDKNVYKYYETLIPLISNNGQPSAAPANPVNNWSGGILGVFGAYSESSTQITLP